MKQKKQLTIKDFYIKAYIPWEECERVMGKRMFNRFNKWMGGQTCYLEGVYEHDLDRFLNNLPVVD